MSASVPQTKLRLDRSRVRSTIHGERAPGDPHQFAFFLQDGIHFDAHGFHLEELLDDKTRALVEKRLKRQTKAAPKEEDAGDGDDGDADPDSKQGSGSDPGDVNLEAWLRGEAKYQWFSVTKVMRERYHQNMSKQVDVIEWLVYDQKIIQESELDPELLALLKPAQG